MSNVGGSDPLVLSLKIDTGKAGTDLQAIGKALDDLAKPRGTANNKTIEDLTRKNAELAAQLQKSSTQLAQFQKGFDDSSKAVSRASGVTTSYRATIDNLTVSYREAVKISKEQVKAAAIEEALRRRQKAAAAEQAAMLGGMMAMRKSYDSYMTSRGTAIAAVLKRESDAQKAAAAEQAAMLGGMMAMRKSYDSYMTSRGTAIAAVLKRESDAQKAAAAEQAAMLGGMMAMRKSYDSYMTKRGDTIVAMMRREAAEQKKAAAETAALAKAQQAAAVHTHGLNTAQAVLHSTLRGVSGVLGGLWLTYAKFVPVLLAAAAATKTVKDSFSAGLELNFLSQFVATLETQGNSSVEAVRNLRNNIAAAVIEESRDSVFTTQQNAEALQKLALAGIESARGLELLGTASQAAVFGQTSLAEATGMVLDTLYNFNLASYDATIMADNFDRVGNIMAYTASTVNTTFTDLARAFQNITGVAGTFNIEIEEASALLQGLAEAGIRGQKAGTYVRNFLDDILGAPISRRAESALSNLGVERFDPSQYGQYGVSQYIDSLIVKLKELDFVEQQNTIRAITNQRSRRVLRQELINSYDEEARLINRVRELAEKADGSLEKMSRSLQDSGRYALLMAQSAYNATVTSAYQDANADVRFQSVGKILQETFNSTEFNEIVRSFVRGVATMGEAAVTFFAKVVEYKDVLVTAFDFATNLAALGALYFGVTRLAAGAAALGLAFRGVAAAATAAFATNPVTLAIVGVATLASTISIAASNWSEYKRQQALALNAQGETTPEISALEKQLAAVREMAEQDYTGFSYSASISRIEERLAAARAELAQVIKDDLTQTTETLAREMQQLAISLEERRLDIRDQVRNSGLSGDAAQELEFSELNSALKQAEAQQSEFLARLNKMKADGADKNAIKAARQQLAEVNDAIDLYINEINTNVEASLFSRVPDVIKDNWGKGLDSLREKVSEANEEISKLLFDEDQRLSIDIIGAEQGFEFARSMEDAAWATLRMAEASGTATDRMRMQAIEASEMTNASQELVSTLISLREAKDFAAGKGVMSADTILGLDEIKIKGLTESLVRQTEQIGMTSDKLSELQAAEFGTAIATLEHAKARAISAGTSIDLIASYQSQITAIQALQAAQVEYQRKAGEKKTTGGGGGSRVDRDPIRSAIESARSAVQEYRNTFQEAMGVINEQRSMFDIGPSEAYAQSIQAITTNYDAMIAKLREAQNVPGIKATEKQKLETDALKLEGDRAKQIREQANQLLLAKQEIDKKFEQSEIEVGRKVLSARESWIREYNGKFGDTIKTVGNELKTAQAALDKALDTGKPESEVAALRAEVARLQTQLKQLAGNRELGAWAAEIEEAFKQGQDAIKLMDEELSRLAQRSEEGGLLGILGGNAANFESQKARLVASIQAQIAEVERQIEIAEANGATTADLKLRLSTLDGQLQEAVAQVDPVLQSWGDSLGDYIANGIVYGFDQGESPAKAFGNFLKAELVKSIAAALSRQFVMNLTGIFGGSAGGAAGVAGQAAGGIGNAFSLLNTGKNIWNTAGQALSAGSIFGTASAYGSAIGATATGVGSQAAMLAAQTGQFGAAGLSATAGAAGGSGLMAGAAAAMPWIAGAFAIGSLLGVFDKKPSNKAAWGEVDLSSGATSDVGGMTGEKAPSDQTLQARDMLLQAIGAFGQVTNTDGTIKIDVGERDGIQASFNGGEMESLGTDADKAVMTILDRIVETSKLDPTIIAQWQVLKTSLDGTTKSAFDMVDVMGLLTQEVAMVDIERANLIKGANETLGQSYTNLAVVMGINQTAGEQWTLAQRALQKGFEDLNLSTPRTIAEFRQLASGIDITTEEGQKLYQEVMGLAPAFMTLAGAIEQTQVAIAKTADDAIRTLELSILDSKGKYEYLDAEIVQLIADMKTAVDPATIQQIYESATGKVMEAYNLLDSEEQQRLNSQYIERIADLERLANERLTVVPEPLTDEQKGLNGDDLSAKIEAAITAAMEKAAAAMGDAADKQVDVAGLLAAAVGNIPDSITVQNNVTVTIPEVGGR